jgi:hypothetical protein
MQLVGMSRRFAENPATLFMVEGSKKTAGSLINVYQITRRLIPETMLFLLSLVDKYRRFGETPAPFFVRRLYGHSKFLGECLANYMDSYSSNCITYAHFSGEV